MAKSVNNKAVKKTAVKKSGIGGTKKKAPAGAGSGPGAKTVPQYKSAESEKLYPGYGGE